jgi:NAD+ diphosphatase
MRFVPGDTGVSLAPEHLCLPVRDDGVLLHPDGAIPTVEQAGELTEPWLIGRLDGMPVWSGVTGDDRGLKRHGWGSVASRHAAPETSAAARAIAITAWRRNHRYCGTCRAELADVPGVIGRRCAACGLNLPMPLQPVVLVAVCREDEVLLVRHSYGHTEIWALVSGLVEAGESLEECGRREVAEEVGLQVADLRYAGSQPWGWGSPGLLLAAYTARWTAGEIMIDPEELTEARWFRLDALPENLPPAFSIARSLLDDLAVSAAFGRK